jgi:MraZ protein
MLKSAGLTGRSDNKVDSKGRLAIPASMRKVLAPGETDEVVVLGVPTGHLLLFNREYWGATIQQNIIDRQAAIGQENVWRAVHRLSENSHMSTVDSQGRITIPHRLLEKAGINGEAVVIGAFDRVSVWAPGRYETWINESDIDSTIADMGIF